MYLNSGGTPEYCYGFGLEFTENNFENKLSQFINSYEILFQNIKKYPLNATVSNSEYLKLFESLYERRDEIISSRKKFSFIYIIYFYLINRKNSLFKIYIGTVKNLKDMQNILKN